ncbi:MAG: TIGR02186 family protein [Candidatus Omnitrophica bacterium]|nr:TIGR02186 family protein [Candidatus Omnitrophota bacterium]
MKTQSNPRLAPKPSSLLKRLIGLFLLCLLAPFIATAQNDAFFPTIFEEDAVHINLDFKGDEVRLFGSAPSQTDGIVAVLRSQETPPMHLSRKKRVVLFWMTVKKFLVDNLPGCYQIASSDPLHQLIKDDSQTDSRFGYEALRNDWRYELESGQSDPDDESVLFDGLIQMKENQGLYKIDENGARLHDNGLFLCRFYLPAAITTGQYIVQIFALRQGRIVGASEASLSVEKRGLAWALTYTAANHSVLYALIAVTIALSAGVLVSFLFKRKSAH